MRLSAFAAAAAITCLSNASFAQDVRGYGYAPGTGIEAYDYGPWWQYRGGPKSTSTTSLNYGAPNDEAYGFGPPPDRYYEPPRY
jgi:hypothetical protein